LEDFREVVFILDVARPKVGDTDIKLIIVVRLGRRRQDDIIECNPICLRIERTNILNSHSDETIE